MNGDELRKSFIDFFAERGHVELPSLPLILRDDPSVLFVTAGMQQMIPFFVGETEPPSRRLSSIQKCIRTVDIEDVGDEQHLTFFEMLGNFSVGDYFVPDALRFTWTYLTDILSIPVERLWATVYPGDDLARDNWLEIGMPVDRVVEDESNWWTRAGLAGPAGPDSEVHYDRGRQYGCGEPDCSPVDGRPNCHRFVEIWNNVFMDSFVNEKNEVLRPLSSKNIDTGQGFERLLMVIQGAETVYETDVFAPIVAIVARAIGTPYMTDGATDRTIRIIADHCRTLTMAMSDGGIPGNEGRGYVLRRLIRRAVLRGRLLGVERPFLEEPIREVIRIMSPRYQNVAERADSILGSIRLEEVRFAEMLVRGKPLLESFLEAAAKKNGVVPGTDAFLLHDTYGLPLELIVEVASERSVAVDTDGFEAELRHQQDRGRASRATGEQKNLESLAVLAERVSHSEFLGYTEPAADANVVGLIAGERLRDAVTEGDDVEIILDRTPFYAESGGQVGDTGTVTGPRGTVQVVDTQKPFGGIIVHRGTVISGSLATGDRVRAQIDSRRRAEIRPHHSATHLLHVALHEVLGPQATQAGSLVAPDRLRFDFHWPQAVGEGELVRIQTRINELVFDDEPVVTREMGFDEAVAEGAMALFGEKYGATVRMVQMGPSKELCGGTHVSETLDIGPVVILSESGIGSGVRRIEALAGRAAFDHLSQTDAAARTVAKILGTPADRLLDRASDVMDQLRAAEKRIQQLTRRIASQQAAELTASAEPLNGSESRFVVRRVPADSADDLLQLAAATSKSLGSGIVVLGSVVGGKPQFAASVSKDLEPQGYNARAIAQKVGQVVGGGAGGSGEFAQGGGRDANRLDEGLDQAQNFVRGLAH
jgi:alanyl-tRNA synthetase